MPRNLSPAMLAALAKPTIPLALFVEISFANETLYLFGGVGTFNANGPLPILGIQRAGGNVTALIPPVTRIPFGVGATVQVQFVPDASFDGSFPVTAITPILFGPFAGYWDIVWAQAGPTATSAEGSIATTTPTPDTTFPYSQLWTGLGWLAKISGIPQTTKVQAQNITLSLSGIPSELVLDAINHVRMSGTATVWLGFFDSNGYIIADPVQLFQGALDVPSIDDSGETCTLSITCENPLINLNLAPNRRFDDCDQQIYFPGDLGMSFVNALANLQLYWPAPVTSGTPYPISLSLTPNGADILVGGTVQLTFTAHMSDGSTQVANPLVFVQPASSNPAIATVSSGGLVTGRSPGVCDIETRLVVPSAPGVPNNEVRSSCTVIVRTL